MPTTSPVASCTSSGGLTFFVRRARMPRKTPSIPIEPALFDELVNFRAAKYTSLPCAWAKRSTAWK